MTILFNIYSRGGELGGTALCTPAMQCWWGRGSANTHPLSPSRSLSSSLSLIFLSPLLPPPHASLWLLPSTLTSHIFGVGNPKKKFWNDSGGVEGVIGQMRRENCKGKHGGRAYCGPKIVGRAPLPSTHPPLLLVQNAVIASDRVRRCLLVTARANAPL